MIPTVALWRPPQLGATWKPALRQAQPVASEPADAKPLELYGQQLLKRGVGFGFGVAGGLGIMTLLNLIAPKSLGAIPGAKPLYLREAALTAIFGAVTLLLPLRSVTLDALSLAWGTFTGASLGNAAYASTSVRRRSA